MRRFCIGILFFPYLLSAQDAYLQADSAFGRGEPWRASQLLQPALMNPTLRTPATVLLAARAAAAWEGWSTVRRLLEREPWLDTRYDRLGRRLLAEANLADNRNAEALASARLSLGGNGTRDEIEQGRRLLLVARAYDRLDQFDSAAQYYRRAAGILPQLSDWLALRAAGVTADSTQRAQLYAGIALPAATPRVPWTEALARERTGDFAGAAIRYDRLGAHVAAWRNIWRGATSDSVRRVVASGIADLVRSAGAAEARDALDLIAQLDPPFTREQRLTVARRAVAINRAQDAVDGFARAARDAPLTARDRVAYGTALGLLNRWTDAAAQFAAVEPDPAVAGQAAYFHARALLRAGQNDAAIAALRDVVLRHAGDTTAAATAWHLLADLSIDAGEVDSAREDYLALAARYPTSSLRPHAILLAALIALQRGHPATTARELAHAMELHWLGNESDAARYWIGRAHWGMHDSLVARSEWRELLSRGPENYYAVRAAARLDTIPWTTLTLPVLDPPDSLADRFARAALLDELGLDAEARFERDRIAAEAHGADAERVAEAFLARGFTSRATQLAQRALSAGAPRDPSLWRLLYPMPFAGSLRADAAREQVDPLLVASVIRQESGFEPHATSRTNARGLMQVEPATGRELASVLGFPDFDPALLWVAQVNLVLGIHHFSEALQRYPDLERGLAAYNAGTSRVDHWSMSPLNGDLRSIEHAREPLDDVEMFVERIPYVETRDYVRAIIRNREVYRMVYGG